MYLRFHFLSSHFWGYKLKSTPQTQPYFYKLTCIDAKGTTHHCALFKTVEGNWGRGKFTSHFHRGGAGLNTRKRKEFTMSDGIFSNQETIPSTETRNTCIAEPCEASFARIRCRTETQAHLKMLLKFLKVNQMLYLTDSSPSRPPRKRNF